MYLFILTYGRPDQQPTYAALRHLPYEVQIRAATPESIPRGLEFITVLVETEHVGAARQAVLDYVREHNITKFVLLDDDLKFYTRQGTHFVAATHYEVTALFAQIDRQLDVYAHVGVTQRFMAHTKLTPFVENERYIKLAAYNSALFSWPWPEFRLSVHEDVDFQLQLARQDKPACILTNWAIDDYGQYKPGGCQRYRTPAVELAEWEKLARLHPGFVDTTNHRVKWKRAYDSRNNR